MAIEIKVLRQGDETILRHVAAGVFDNPVDPDLTREFLADPAIILLSPSMTVW
jgi:hypothetical protein